ncbi:MAG: MATE family efflux transporter, partial [Spirochaetales bacterium]|nr:MATE family efflux transporter [Candidatus Physcosoma equi]
MDKKNSFQWGPFLKAVATISIPIALANLLTTTGSMVDTMMIASLGENSVAAVGLCAQFSSLLFSCYWGFVGGGILFFSQYWGSKDERGIERSYGIVLSCMMVVGVVFASLALFFPHFIMKVYTDKESIQRIGEEYLRVVGLAYPLQIYATCLTTCLRSTERVRIPLIGSICSVLSNLFLNWVFIFGNLGFPAMGVRGAALATTLAALINVLVVLVASRATSFLYIFRFRHHFAWNREFLALFFKKCFPIICNELFIGVGNMVINVALGHQSEPTIAAVAVFRTLEGFIIAFFTGFASATSVLIGKRVGSGELDDAYESALRLVYLCQVVILLAMVLVLTIHSPLLGLLGLSGESYRTCTSFLWIFSFFGVVRMGNWVQNEICRSSGDATTGTVMEISFMALMIIPSVAVSAFLFHAPVL